MTSPILITMCSYPSLYVVSEQTANTKGAVTEAKSINLSLHYLEQVVVYLREQANSAQQQHIPYRNSVLTNMLRDSLGGNCRSCFVMTLSLDKDHFSETISTCRY
jgi:kinesin family protein 6/9